MTQVMTIEKNIKELLAEDPLFKVIKDTPNEQHFLTEPYLNELIEKKYYSTPEVANWFHVTDAQLRYYIKPFQEYLFDDPATNPTSANVIRLDYKAILKLRMILLLKDEYRMKGLKQLLRVNKDGHIIKQIPTQENTPAAPNTTHDKRLDTLSEALSQIMQTGLFQMEQDEATDKMKLTLNENFLHNKIKALPAEPSKEIEQLQSKTAQLEKQNEELAQKVDGFLSSNKEDIAIRIREKHIEQSVLNILETEALAQYAKEKRWQLFAKLFNSTQAEIAKKQYIAAYIEKHYPTKLQQALHQYHIDS